MDDDILSLQDFDHALNLCYSAGYHDGAFPKEPSYADKFEATRLRLIKHDAALRAGQSPAPVPPGEKG